MQVGLRWSPVLQKLSHTSECMFKNWRLNFLNRLVENAFFLQQMY